MLHRRYGTVETNLIQADGTTKRGALFNYHEYKLAKPHDGGTCSVLYHVFVTKEKAKRSRKDTHVGHSQNPGGAFTWCQVPPALRLQRAGDGKQTKFMGFIRGPRVLGSLTESDTGGLQLQSTGGDVSEWHRLADDQTDELKEGDLVSIVDGLVSLQCCPGAMLAVVTRKAMVEGSSPADTRRHEKLAYTGRVPVRVRGPVRCGDHIVPSGLHDGTGIRANSLNSQQGTVGAVLSLGAEPNCGGQPWLVEIAVTPPGLTVGVVAASRKPMLSHVAKLLLSVALAVAALLYAFMSPEIDGGGASSTSVRTDATGAGTDGRMEQAECTLARWDAVMELCEEDLSAFYSESDPYGEGGILNMLTSQRTGLNDGRSGADMVMSSLDLGSVVNIGATCSSHMGRLCGKSLRRYLDGCPLAPLPVQIKVKPTQRTDIVVPGSRPRMGRARSGSDKKRAGSMDGMADVVFVRQCLSQNYPQLLIPNVLASVAQDTGQVSMGPPADANQHECAALEAVSDVVRTECAACATAAGCAQPRTAQAIQRMFSSCPSSKHLLPGDLPQLHNGTLGDGSAYEWFSVPKVDVVGMSQHVLTESSLSKLVRVLWVEEQQRPGSECTSEEPSCQCYARGTQCNAAIASALAKLAILSHRTSCPTAQGHAMPNNGPTRLPPPSALATMLSAAEGQRFFQAVEGSAASAAVAGHEFRVVVGSTGSDDKEDDIAQQQ